LYLEVKDTSNNQIKILNFSGSYADKIKTKYDAPEP
jgi:hypothetical protein